MKLRARLAKLGRARFLSHRDLQRTLDRALRRSGLPVAYSQGFTPHPRISYGPALATGYSSAAEFFDLELSAPVAPTDFVERLNGSLPEGLKILEAREVAPQGPKLGARIAAAEYVITLNGVTLQAMLPCSDQGGIQPGALLAGMREAAPGPGAAEVATVHRVMLYSRDPETGWLIPPW